MVINPERVAQLNQLLASRKLDIPDFRRTVTRSGGNLVWLQANICKRNVISDELAELLDIRVKGSATSRTNNDAADSQAQGAR